MRNNSAYQQLLGHSQGLCFLGRVHWNDFVRAHLGERPGAIVDEDGRELGGHRGHRFLTLGQRHGLGLSGGPYFVVAKDPERDLIVVRHTNDPRPLANTLELARRALVGPAHSLANSCWSSCATARTSSRPPTPTSCRSPSKPPTGVPRRASLWFFTAPTAVSVRRGWLSGAAEPPARGAVGGESSFAVTTATRKPVSAILIPGWRSKTLPASTDTTPWRKNSQRRFRAEHPNEGGVVKTDDKAAKAIQTTAHDLGVPHRVGPHEALGAVERFVDRPSSAQLSPLQCNVHAGGKDRVEKARRRRR